MPPPPPQTLQYLIILRTCREGAPLCLQDFSAPMSPSHDATILNYLNDRVRGRHYFLQDFGAPPPPLPSPDATILNNLNDREGAPLCLQDFSATNAPSHDATILNNLIDRERGHHYFLQDFGAPPPLLSPGATIYLTILITERGRHYVCRILAPPMSPSHDATILNYLNDRVRGRHYFLQDFGAPPPLPSPDATILNNLNDREGAPLCLQDFSATNAPSHDATILNYLNDRERWRHYFFPGLWRPPSASPPPQTSQYLTILMTGRRRHYVCRMQRHQCPPPTTPQYLDDRERGAPIAISCKK